MNLIQLFSQLLGSGRTELSTANLTNEGKLDDAFSKLLTEKGFDKKDLAKFTQLLESQKNERKAFVNKAGIEVSIEYPIHLIKKQKTNFEGLKEQIAKLPNASEIQENGKPLDLPTNTSTVKSPTKVVVPQNESIRALNAKFQILADNHTLKSQPNSTAKDEKSTLFIDKSQKNATPANKLVKQQAEATKQDAFQHTNASSEPDQTKPTSKKDAALLNDQKIIGKTANWDAKKDQQPSTTVDTSASDITNVPASATAFSAVSTLNVKSEKKDDSPANATVKEAPTHSKQPSTTTVTQDYRLDRLQNAQPSTSEPSSKSANRLGTDSDAAAKTSAQKSAEPKELSIGTKNSTDLTQKQPAVVEKTSNFENVSDNPSKEFVNSAAAKTNKHINSLADNQVVDTKFQVNRSKVEGNTSESASLTVAKQSKLAQPKVRFISSQNLPDSSNENKPLPKNENPQIPSADSNKKGIPEVNQAAKSNGQASIWNEKSWDVSPFLKEETVKIDAKKNDAKQQVNNASAQAQQVELKQELSRVKNERQNTADATEFETKITSKQQKNDADFQQMNQQNQQKSQQFSSQLNKAVQANMSENSAAFTKDFNQQLDTSAVDLNASLSMANTNRTVKMGKEMDVQKVQETIVNQIRYAENTEWNRQRIVMDDGSSLRFNIRKVGETLQLQLVGPQSELNKMVQLNAVDIKAHLEQQLGLKVDLQFSQSDGNDQQSNQRNESQNLFGSMGGNGNEFANGQNLSNSNDRNAQNANASLNDSIRSTDANQQTDGNQNPIDGWVG